MAALGLAIQALNTANSTRSGAAGTVSGDAATTPNASQTPSAVPMPTEDTSAPIDPAGTDVPSDPGTATLPPAAATYTPSYQDQQLRLRPNGDGCGSRTVDFDQPAVNVVDELKDMEYQSNCGATGPVLHFASDKVATVTSPTAGPNDCAEAIRLSPSSQDVNPSQDLVVCGLTNGVGAPGEPARAKMVRVVVTGVGRDQSVDLTATAWEIPH